MKLPLTALAILLPALAAAPDNIKGNAFGNPKAPLTIEVFSDFQCPGCKRFHDEELPTIMKDYVTPGKAYLIYRYFPLPQHPYGRKTAELVWACAQLGKYEAAANALFATQQSWSQSGKVEEQVNSVLSPEEQKKLATILKDPALQTTIDHDLEEGRGVPISSTPTMFITFKNQHFRIFGEGLFNYKWVKATFDDFLK